jgi:GT2 family glycosyltransferase
MVEPLDRRSISRSHGSHGCRVRAVIVIPSWDGQQHLARCLPALSVQTCQEFRVVLVDNGSTDDSIPWVRQHHPDTEIIALDRNCGFAAACNSGIRATDAELIVTLNNDTAPGPDWLEELLSAADHHADVGMFASILWLDKDPPVVDAAGIEVNRLGVAWNLARGLPLDELPSTPREVFGPCGGAALYRRQLFEDVGLFDETFFAYLEDAELAWRARWAGWECMSLPSSTVSHIHSATGGRNLPQKYWLLGRNRLWMILRHYPRPYLRRYWVAIVLNELLSGLLGMMALRSPAPLQGRLSALRQWRRGTVAPFPSPRRLSAAELFAFLAPVGSVGSLASRYIRDHRDVQTNTT